MKNFISKLRMSTKGWFIGFIIILLVMVLGVAGLVILVDPYFHFHRPIGRFFYVLDNERAQNDGILRHFDYDAVITGTSMTENFKKSEVDAAFGVNSAKTAFAGGSYKEIGETIARAEKYNPNIRLVIRSIDVSLLFYDKDYMDEQDGSFPTYLYDNNPFNDVQYIFNKDILLNRVKPIVDNYLAGAPGGVTAFDDFSNWMTEHGTAFGPQVVLTGDDYGDFPAPTEIHPLTEEDKTMIRENVEQNILSVARANPQTTFYCFYPPYSVAWWGKVWSIGELQRYVDAEKYAASLILECDNVKMFSFVNHQDVTGNLGLYKDGIHYSEAVNSWMVACMQQGVGLLTKENLDENFQTAYDTYSNYDFMSLFDQLNPDAAQTE